MVGEKPMALSRSGRARSNRCFVLARCCLLRCSEALERGGDQDEGGTDASKTLSLAESEKDGSGSVYRVFVLEW